MLAALMAPIAALSASRCRRVSTSAARVSARIAAQLSGSFGMGASTSTESGPVALVLAGAAL